MLTRISQNAKKFRQKYSVCSYSVTVFYSAELTDMLLSSNITFIFSCVFFIQFFLVCQSVFQKKKKLIMSTTHNSIVKEHDRLVSLRCLFAFVRYTGTRNIQSIMSVPVLAGYILYIYIYMTRREYDKTMNINIHNIY